MDKEAAMDRKKAKAHEAGKKDSPKDSPRASVDTQGKHWFLGVNEYMLPSKDRSADGSRDGSQDAAPDGSPAASGNEVESDILGALEMKEDRFDYDFVDDRLVSLECDGGCRSKLRPLELDVYLGSEGMWDKRKSGLALRKLESGQALAQNVVSLVPMVNDARSLGRICAATALQPFLARGGTAASLSPLWEVPEEMAQKRPTVLRRLMQGYKDVAEIAGCEILGGQVLPAESLKVGAACCGLLDKAPSEPKMRHRQYLVLTRGIGAGVLANAVKGRWEDWQASEKTLVESMGAPDLTAARFVRKYGLVSGFAVNRLGLAGHLIEAVYPRGELCVELWVDNVPVLENAKEIASDGLVPGLTLANKRFFREYESWKGEVDEDLENLIHDGCANGGLVLIAPSVKVRPLVHAFEREGRPAAVIGQVKSKSTRLFFGQGRQCELEIVRGERRAW